MDLVALGPLLRAGVDQLGVGLVAGAQRPLDHAGGVVEAAQHPGHVAPRRVRQLPLGQRLGRLALEVDDLPALRGAQGLAEVQVAVDPAGRRGRRAWTRAPNAARSVAACSASSGTTPSAASSRPVIVGGELGRGRGRPGLGRELVAQGLVHLAQRLAEPGRLAGEVAAGVVGVHLRVGEQRADAGQRQVPAVGGRAQELLQHRQLQRLARRRRRRASRRARRRARSPARVSTSCTAMSGLTPGVTLRNTFISASSPKATEELDCSPLNSVECASRSSSWPGSRWNRSPSVSVTPSLGRRRRRAATGPWRRGRGARRRRAPSRGRGPPTSPRRRGRAGVSGCS